jgi:hippurate hydrolase
VEGYAAAHDVSAEIRYSRDYPVTVNTPSEADACARVAEGMGLEVERDRAPAMGAEDFAFMLEERPGAYVWLGNGPSTGGGNLHSPTYDFNDDILVPGARYWTRLVEHLMPA